MRSTDERILTVPRAALFHGDWPQGFVPLSADDAALCVTELEQHGEWVARSAAETDPGRKQPIPYCVLRRNDEVFCVERLTAQGEPRLHNRLSIGLGGHVDASDGPRSGSIRRALLRELREELVLTERAVVRLGTAPILGLLNDDSNDVGAVHVGVVFEVRLLPDESVAVGEKSKMRGGFRPVVGSGDVWQDAAALETWSALLLSAISSRTSDS